MGPQCWKIINDSSVQRPQPGSRRAVIETLMLRQFGDKYIHNALRIFEQRYSSANYDIDVLIELLYGLKINDQLKANPKFFINVDEIKQILLKAIGFPEADVAPAMFEFEQEHRVDQPLKPYDLRIITSSIMKRRTERLQLCAHDRCHGGVTAPYNDAEVYDSDSEATHNASTAEATPMGHSDAEDVYDTEAKYNPSAVEATPMPAMPTGDLSSQYCNRHDDDDEESSLIDVDKAPSISSEYRRLNLGGRRDDAIVEEDDEPKEEPKRKKPTPPSWTKKRFP